MKREADHAHIPSRAQRGMALAGAVAVGSATCAGLSGITTAVSTVIFTGLGYDRWTSDDAPAAVDVAGFLAFLLILAVAIQVGRATHRATLKLLTQNDSSDS